MHPLATKVLPRQVTAHPRYARAMAWGRLVTLTGAAQVVVQAIGFVGGILVIRLLPTQEYALYTLANTMLGAMIVLADSGISRGLMSLGGRVWQSPAQLGRVLVTGLELRTRFAAATLVVLVPLLLVLLRQHGASWPAAILVAAALVPAFFTGLSNTLLEVVPKLHQDIAPLQRNQVEANAGRLLLLLLTLFAFPVAGVAILAASLPQVWTNQRLQKLVGVYADQAQPADPAYRTEIIKITKRSLPGAIYLCLSGQITVWLISLTGSTAAIAQLGALTRLTVVIGLFGVVFSTLVVPRFARLPPDGALLRDRFIQSMASLVVIGAGLVGIAWLCPDQILWVLGSRYAGLRYELVLSVLSSSLALVAAGCYGLSISRGWIINPLIAIPVALLTTALGVYILDISSLAGVLWLNALVYTVEICLYVVYCFVKIFGEPSFVR